MTQEASTSDAEADNNAKPKPVKVKIKNGRDQDQSNPAKKPRHSEIKENNHNWKCAICTVGFGSWNELNMHVKSAHEITRVNTKYQSRICEKNYISNVNLQRHLKMAHSNDLLKTVAAVTEKTVLIKDTVNLSHNKGKVPSFLPPSKAFDMAERTVLIEEKENITKHVKNKPNLVRTKPSLIQYQCMHCRMTEDTFDAAVYHAQVHLVQEALTKENGSQYRQAFDNHKSANNSSIRIIFDYKTLLKDTWFDMFQDLSTSLEIEASSLYRHTRCVKLNWDSRSRHTGQGRCVVLYQCGVCKLIVDPAKVQKHCDKNGACVAGGQGYKCKECQISFYSSKALRRHKERHKKKQSVLVKIATFNNKDDVHFNNILKQISLSSVEDTEEDTELEKISSNPETPENDSLENEVQVSCFDFQAHNAYHENKTNRTIETIVGQIEPSCSVKAGANKVSPGENVSNAYNTRKDFLKNRSKDNDYDRIENGTKSFVTAWDSDDETNDSNREPPAQLNLKKSFEGGFTRKEEITQKNSNDNINSVININHDNVPKEEIIHRNNQNDQSAFKRRRISDEDNNPGGMFEVDNKSQSTKDQRENSEENYVDQRNGEVQEDTRTTANIGAVNKPVNVEIGVLDPSEYVSLNGNMAILRGSFNQDDSRFNWSRGKQCTGIAAVACAAFYVLDPNVWTKNVIDQIVVIGDEYYKNCIATRPLPAAGEINPNYLAVTDLMPTIIFQNDSVPIAIVEKENLNGHIDKHEEGFPNLKNALEHFFTNHASGILTTNAMSVAVYYQTVEETYWLFDSHSRGPEGGPAFGGAACCIRFSHLDDLHALLRRTLFVSPSTVPKGRDLINSFNVYSLTPLNIR